MSQTEGYQRLTSLWKEAVALADAKPVLSEAFRDWNNRARLALVQLCGSDSEAVRDFQNTRYEPQDSLLDVAKRVISKAKKKLPLAGTNIPLTAAEEHADRQGLERAAEILLAARTTL